MTDQQIGTWLSIGRNTITIRCRIEHDGRLPEVRWCLMRFGSSEGLWPINLVSKRGRFFSQPRSKGRLND